MMQHIRIWILLACTLLAVFPAATGAKTLQVPLAEYMPDNRQIDLRSASSQYTLSIPVSRRAPLTRARLHLRATNSISLLGNRSQLVVLVNEQVIAQVPLKPGQPEIEADIELPVAVLRNGYNRLTFSVAQHYTDKCEDPGSPELWVQVDSLRSTLSLETSLRKWQPRLSELADIFDAKLGGQGRINIITAGSARLNDSELKWGALAVQGAALRLEYVPLAVRYRRAARVRGSHGNFPGLDQSTLSGADNILIGTREQLSGLLPAGTLHKISDGFLAIYPLDADPAHFVVVISGVNEAQVESAAQAFAMLNFPYPDTTFLQVSKVERHRTPDYSALNTIYPNGHYTFHDLGFRTHTVQGMFAEAMDLAINIPPALFGKQSDTVALHLRFAYGASMRQDSVLNIFLNGQFENVIALQNKDGGYYRDYTVTIPLRSFQPGRNMLTFIPRMMPLITGECQTIQTGNLALTLFEDSRIDMPNAAYLANMPDLSLLARAGFPYTVKNGGENVTVYLPQADGQSAAAAWMLLGKMTQITRLPMLDVHVSSSPKKREGDWLIVSALDGLPQEITEHAPVKLGEQTRMPYPMAGGPGNQAADLGWQDHIWQFLNDLFVLAPQATPNEPAYITGQGAGLGRNAMILQYQAPWGRQQTATLVTAASGDVLADNVQDLIQSGKWSQLKGDYGTWRNETGMLYTQQVGGEYVYGGIGMSSRLSYYFSRHPLFWLAGIMLLLIALSLVTLRIIMRYKRRYHADVKEQNEEALNAKEQDK